MLLALDACASVPRTESSEASVAPPEGISLSAPTALTRLNGDEIRGLIVGRTLSHDVNRKVDGRGVVVLSDYREMYRIDGTVGIQVHRAGTHGRYTISGDKLCISIDRKPPEFRQLFRAADGTLLQKDAQDSAGGMIPIIIE